MVEPSALSGLFTPFKLRSVTLPNRIVMPAMGLEVCHNGVPLPQVADHCARRITGGTGLVMTEGVYIDHPSSGEFKQQFDYDIKGDGHPKMLTAWEIVAANTDPHYVSFEIDIHWARLGIGLDRFDDLLQFLKTHRDRIALLHIKDTTPDGKIADLGRGTTDWKRVIDAAGSQVKYYIWEFDSPPQPLESAKIAYDYMRCGKH